MASFFTRRCAAAIGIGAAAYAAAIPASSAEDAESAPEESSPPSSPPPSTEGAAVVFLDAESRERMSTLFEKDFDRAIVRGGEAPRGFSLGATVEMEVRSIARAVATQRAAVLCSVAEASGTEAAPSTFYAVAEEAAASAVGDALFERLARAKVLEVAELPLTAAVAWRGRLLSNDGDGDGEGDEVSLERVPPISANGGAVVRGILCTADRWDAATGMCATGGGSGGGEEEEEVHECGFCKFMKAGPCGEAFVAWEACVEKCKDTDMDFIEKCGNQTLALKDCVDLNPDYYAVLSELDDEVEVEVEEEV